MSADVELQVCQHIKKMREQDRNIAGNDKRLQARSYMLLHCCGCAVGSLYAPLQTNVRADSRRNRSTENEEKQKHNSTSAMARQRIQCMRACTRATHMNLRGMHGSCVLFSQPALRTAAL